MPDIADLIGDLGDQDDLGFTDATLTKTTTGARTAGNLAAGPAKTTTNYGGRGTIVSTGRFSSGTLVKENHVLISLLGSTIGSGAVPTAGDTITIANKEHPAGKTYRVTVVENRDGIGAVYECEASR